MVNPKEQTEEQVITLNEESTPEQENEFSTEGLLPQEVETAKKLGLVKEPNEQQKQPISKTEENPEEKEEVVEEHPTFEQVDQNKDLLKKYNKNEQALYWKYKADRKKRQEAEEEKESLKAELELSKVKDSAASIKLKRVEELLSQDKELTVKEILEIIKSEESEKKEESPKVNPQEKELQKRKERVEFMEEIGRSQHEDFDNLVELAAELTKVTPRYQKRFEIMLADPNLDPQEVIDEVVEVAKKNPKYTQGKQASTAEKAKVEKAIKNSEKKPSSAAISTSGNREITESSLTVEQASRLSPSQWRALKPETKKRILMGKNP